MPRQGQDETGGFTMTETGNIQRNTVKQSRNRRGGARLNKAEKEPNKIIWTVRGLKEVAYSPQRLNRGSLKRHNFWRRVLYIAMAMMAIIAVALGGKLALWYAAKEFDEAHPATISAESKRDDWLGILPVSYAMAVRSDESIEGWTVEAEEAREQEVEYQETGSQEVGHLLAMEMISKPELVQTITEMNGESIEVQTYELEDTELETEERADEAPTEQEKACEFVLDIAEPDPNYQGSRIELTEEDRYEATCIIEGEDNAHGFEGAVLVAQALHDAMKNDGYKTVRDVRINMGYTGWNDQHVSQSTLDAIDWVFDQGNAAVQHRILYFYSSNGGWHETQHFIVELGRHRFFDRWN